MNGSHLVAVFRKFRALLGAKAWRPRSVDERTWRRWLYKGERPRGDSAKSVALEAWDEFEQPQRPKLKEALLAAVSEDFPEVSKTTWTRESFGAWFFALAERERGGKGKPGESDSLSATVDIQVRDSSDGQFNSTLNKTSLLPVHYGDELRLCVQLSHPAYVCLAWVDQQGKPFPQFPWDWRKAGARNIWRQPVQFEQRREVIVPASSDNAGHILSVKGEAGLETLVVMLNQRCPPPDEILATLPALLRINPMPSRLPTVPRIVRSEFARRPAGVPSDLFLHEPAPLKDPIRALHVSLGNRLAEHFDLTVTVSFPNGGNASKK